MRRIASGHLLAAESVLDDVSLRAGSLGLDVGGHADEIRLDGQRPKSPSVWMHEVRLLRARLDSVAMMLSNYENHRKILLGEDDDFTCACSERERER